MKTGMKLVRLGPAGAEQPAVITTTEDGREVAYSLAEITPDIDGSFLAGGGVAEARAALDAGGLPVMEGTDRLRVGSPIPRPGNVVCIGMNYVAHAAESGSAPPTVPVVFLKPVNTVAGPFDPAPIPPLAQKYDWEV